MEVSELHNLTGQACDDVTHAECLTESVAMETKLRRLSLDNNSPSDEDEPLFMVGFLKTFPIFKTNNVTKLINRNYFSFSDLSLL